MTLQHGRLQERTHIAFRIRLTDPQHPDVTEEVVTENVSPGGLRVLAKMPVEPGCLLAIDSPTHRFHTSVRVVYCQRIGKNEYVLGMELQGLNVNWTRAPGGTAV
ncbi:MAG TPA: PilZ domain-containing protein [Candidatus Acidoferrales bacterium]|nr:PilZ domain-containing protein [Candidatus Acidoferrales bacterium]